MANMALAGLTFLPLSFCLVKNHWIMFLKLGLKIYSLIWPLTPPEVTTMVQLSKY